MFWRLTKLRTLVLQVAASKGVEYRWDAVVSCASKVRPTLLMPLKATQDSSCLRANRGDGNGQQTSLLIFLSEKVLEKSS